MIKQRLFFSLLVVLFPGVVAAALTTKTDNLGPRFKFKDTWSFRLSPYFWYAGLSGHINLQGSQAAFSSSWSEIRHDLDTSVGARLEASYGPWALLLDPDYVKITQTPAVNGFNSKTTYETTVTDAGAFYDLYGTPKASPQHTTLELLGAARIVTFHSSIQFLTGQLPPNISDTSSIVVPLVGLRVQYHFSPRLHSWLSGDFGGFQVSHVSSTWSTSVGLRYNFTDFFDLSLAYKAFQVNYSTQAVTVNTLLQGPLLGCGFSW